MRLSDGESSLLFKDPANVCHRPELNRHGDADTHHALPARVTGQHGIETNPLVSTTVRSYRSTLTLLRNARCPTRRPSLLHRLVPYPCLHHLWPSTDLGLERRLAWKTTIITKSLRFRLYLACRTRIRLLLCTMALQVRTTTTTMPTCLPPLVSLRAPLGCSRTIQSRRGMGTR